MKRISPSPTGSRRSRSRKSHLIKHVDFAQPEDVTLTWGDSKPSTAVDLPRIERAVREIMIAIGEDPDREGLRKTPNRIARAYSDAIRGTFLRNQATRSEVLNLIYGSARLSG